MKEAVPKGQPFFISIQSGEKFHTDDSQSVENRL